MDIREVYRRATGFDPYPYQERLATRDDVPQLLSGPTGLGKTATAVLSWVYRRRFADDAVKRATPRRLVYCLPMRTLVEQTKDAADKWLEKLELTGEEGVRTHLLMGGADDEKWYEHPERDAILIGTQDMLLSRALNRGYGMSRYAWPVQYALLNNDCLWVLDETQLMGVGLTTSAQLDGLRKKLKTYGRCPTLWMSATLATDAIETVDHQLPNSGQWTSETLKDDDYADDNIARVWNARKPISKSTITLESDAKSKNQYPKDLAELILKSHRKDTLSLVVMNRVERAQETFEALLSRLKNGDGPDVDLIHSRFRPHDRDIVQSRALDEQNLPENGLGRVLIATQAIEAGVDVSATTLITELAPWTSLVQRFGRCNRRGKCGHDGEPAASIYWLDIATDNSRQAGEMSLPYDPDQLDRAREVISDCDDGGPSSLDQVKVKDPQAIVHVLRKKDLLDLFDTTPDLSGNDLDISRYIRDSDDTDVQVYWRSWDRKPGKKVAPPDPDKSTFLAPVREELCSVSVKQFGDFLKQLAKNEKTKSLCWTWNPLDKEWEECRASSVRAGQTMLLHCSAGGYSSALGWSGEHKDGPVEAFPHPEVNELPAMDQEDVGDFPISLNAHLEAVGRHAGNLKETFVNDTELPWETIVKAAWWHDVGKAHPAFQGGLVSVNADLDRGSIWAKSGGSGFLDYHIRLDEDTKQRRRGFRHELVSAIAWLQQHDGEPDVDLIAYLIAAHHGKVRLSIRSMPNEDKPQEAERLYARGIWQDDEIPQVEIGNGDISEATTIDLSLMQLGEYEDRHGHRRPSWLTRTLGLRDRFGPFKLAYLETLVRVADWRGSKQGEKS